MGTSFKGFGLEAILTLRASVVHVAMVVGAMVAMVAMVATEVSPTRQGKARPARPDRDGGAERRQAP